MGVVKMRDKVVIGWIDPGQVDGMFALSLANVHAQRRDRIEALCRVEAGGLLSRGRNELVAMYLRETDAEWLLMIDSDEQLGIDTFDKLIDSVHEVERPIVAGLYFGAWRGDYYPTAMPLIFRAKEGTTAFTPFVDYPENELVEIDSAGTGCLLIHRSVFEAIRTQATPHQGTDWCWFMDMPVNGDWFSEDHYFCKRAKQMGFPIYAHTGATLPHRKQFWLEERHHRPNVKTKPNPLETTMNPRRGLEKRG